MLDLKGSDVVVVRLPSVEDTLSGVDKVEPTIDFMIHGGIEDIIKVGVDGDWVRTQETTPSCPRTSPSFSIMENPTYAVKEQREVEEATSSDRRDHVWTCADITKYQNNQREISTWYLFSMHEMIKGTQTFFSS